MTLVSEWKLHEQKLRADFQHYYGIDFDQARAGAHSPWHCACLLVELPPDARTRVAESTDAAWTLNDVLLAGLFNSLNALIYGMSDSRRRGAPPKPIGPEWMTEQGKRTIPALVMKADELMQILNQPREVDECQVNR